MTQNNVSEMQYSAKGTSMKRKQKCNALVTRLNSHMSERYVGVIINGEQCFKTKNGCIFHVEKFPGSPAIVIEYAENEEEAKKNLFEDGDLFYPDEMTEEELIEAMIKEIGAE